MKVIDGKAVSAKVLEECQAEAAALQAEGELLPRLIVDLDRLDHNIDQAVAFAAQAGKALRLVEKSLPSFQLLDYIARLYFVTVHFHDNDSKGISRCLTGAVTGGKVSLPPPNPVDYANT